MTKYFLTLTFSRPVSRPFASPIGAAVLVPLIVIILTVNAGCAYHFGAVAREIPGGYRTVAVPVFKNMTPEAGVEVYFTNALIQEMEREQIGRITAKNDAQVTLEGTIDSIRYAYGNQIAASTNSTTAPVPGTTGDAGSFLPQYTILNGEYRILLQTTLRLRRNSDQSVLWEGTFNGERSYLAPKLGQPGINSANALYNHSARYQNIQAMALDLMTEAHDRLTENF